MNLLGSNRERNLAGRPVKAPLASPLKQRPAPKHSLRKLRVDKPTSEARRPLSDASIQLMGIRIDRITEANAVATIISEIQSGRGGWVVTPNVDVMRILLQDTRLRQKVKDASLMLADGQPLIWASHLQKQPLPERIAGTNLILSLSTAAAGMGAKVFLLGGAPGSAEAAAEVLRRSNPKLQIVGLLAPPMGFDQDPAQMSSIRYALEAADPDIVYVCLGTPKQELVIHELRNFFPSSWFLGLGGSFTIISGRTRRAPEWMQKLGLEWTWRLAKEPRRMFKRYIVHDVPFGLRLLTHALRNRKIRSEPKRVIRPTAQA